MPRRSSAVRRVDASSARSTSSSTMPAAGRAAPSSTGAGGGRAGARWSPPSAAFWWRSRRRGACCRTARRDPVHRRLGERQGLCAIGAVRDGQVRAARPRAEHGARTVAAGHPRRAFRDRRRDPQRGAPEPADRPDTLLDPDAIAESYCSVLRSRAAPGPGSSSAPVGREVLSSARGRVGKAKRGPTSSRAPAQERWARFAMPTLRKQNNNNSGKP